MRARNWLLSAAFIPLATPAFAQCGAMPQFCPKVFPTPAPTDNTNAPATTAFVQALVAQIKPAAPIVQNAQQSVTLATGGTAQTVIAANGALPGGYIYHTGSTAACINFGANAGTPIAPTGAGTGSCSGGAGTYLEPGRGYTLPPGCQSVSVNASDTGHPFQVRAWSYAAPATTAAAIAACAAAAGTTLPTVLALTHSYMVTSTAPGEVVSYVTGALPGTTLTMTDSAGALGIASAPATAGAGVRIAATAAVPVGDDVVTVTETLAGYTPKTTTFTIHAMAQNISGPAFSLAAFANTAAPYYSTSFPVHPSVYNPTTNPTNYDFYDYFYNNDESLASYCSGNGSANRRANSLELEQYSSPGCDGIDPFTAMTGGGVKVTEKVLPAGTTNLTGAATYSSGTLEYKTPYGAYCASVRTSYTLPTGAFPAPLWAYPRGPLGPAEDDPIEAGWGGTTNNPALITRTRHGSDVAGQDTQQSLYLSPDPTQAFHTITSCHTPPNASGKMFTVEALDGVITMTTDTTTTWTGTTQAGGDTATPKLFYQIIDLALGTGALGIASPDVPAQFPAVMYLDYLKIYPSLAQTTKPPFGPPAAPYNVSFNQTTGNSYSVQYAIQDVNHTEPVTDVKATWRPQGTTTWPSANAVGTGAAGYQAITIPAVTNVDFGVFAVSPSGATSPVAYVGSVTAVSVEPRPSATPSNALAYDDFNRVDVAPTSNPSGLAVDPAANLQYAGSPAGIASHLAYFNTANGYQSLDVGTQTEKTCITATLNGADMLAVLHRDGNGILYADLKTGVTAYYSISAGAATVVGSTFTGVTTGTHTLCVRDVGSGSSNIIVSLDGTTVNTGTWTGSGTSTGWIEQGGTPGALRVSLISVTTN